MSLTAILTAEKTSADDKLKGVAEVIAKARDAYGNADSEIGDPECNTQHGSMPFSTLESDGKVAMLRNELGVIKAAAVEAGRTEGVNPNKEIERLLATNPLFCNVDSGTKFEYL